MNTNHQTLPPIAKAVDPTHVVANALAVSNLLHKVWGSTRFGLVLANAYFQQQPLTSEELAEACGHSPETIRRQLKPLINIGRVRVLKSGRSVRYKAKAEWAQWTCDRLMEVVHRSAVPNG